MKYDEETGLWKPSRRSFFFFGASAAVGAMLPEIVAPPLTATEAMIELYFGTPRPPAPFEVLLLEHREPLPFRHHWLDAPLYPVTGADLEEALRLTASLKK